MATKKDNMSYCCQWFAQAHNHGTDNEGYGSLLYKVDDEYYIGCSPLPEIKFCPWCGQCLSGQTQIYGPNLQH